jgi:hypothetical protein
MGFTGQPNSNFFSKLWVLWVFYGLSSVLLTSTPDSTLTTHHRVDLSVDAAVWSVAFLVVDCRPPVAYHLSTHGSLLKKYIMESDCSLSDEEWSAGVAALINNSRIR